MESGVSPEFSRRKIENHEDKSHIKTFLAGTALFALIAPAIAYGVHEYDQKLEQENRFKGKKFEVIDNVELHPWVEASNAVLLPSDENLETNAVETTPAEAPQAPVEIKQEPKPVEPVANTVIVSPAPKPKLAPVTQAPKKTNAPMPATFKWSDGKRVCEKKNDHPTKSKVNNKGKIHMDMECCLDPDEYPNPNCYYDPAKYGKYLDPAHQAKLKSKK